MSEFVCPYEEAMFKAKTLETQEVSIKGIKVEITAVDSGCDLSEDCLLRMMNEAEWIEPYKLSNQVYCGRCGKTATFPKEFLEKLLAKSRNGN